MTENRVLTSCALTRHDDNRNSTVITYSTVHCTAAYVREEGKRRCRSSTHLEHSDKQSVRIIFYGSAYLLALGTNTIHY